MQTSAAGSRIAPQKTVAEALRSGRFSLAYALRSAKDVAEALRELHESGCMHGAVSSGAVLLNSSGAELLPAKKQPPHMLPAVDIAAFGALLYEMAVGEKPAPSGPLSLPFDAPPGEETIYAAVVDLASKCLASVSDSPAEMLRVLSEIILLSSEASAAVSRTATAKPEPPHSAPDTQRFHSTTGGTPSGDSPSGIRCPKCRSPYVYPSRTRTWFERWLATWKCRPMRCRRCLHRFMVVGRFRVGKGSPRQEKG
jgi:serine/threonine protein kinase